MNTLAQDLPIGKPASEPAGNPEERLINKIFGKRPTEFQLAAMVERGLPISSVEVLRKQALSLEETDRTLRLIKVITLADQVFDNREKALRWLRRENERLEGRTPLDMLRSEVGGDLVRQMLYQIDEGIYV
jgi:uncharacterized protein (DUF2384 family)